MSNQLTARGEWLYRFVRECQVLADAIALGEIGPQEIRLILAAKFPKCQSPIDQRIADGLIASAALGHPAIARIVRSGALRPGSLVQPANVSDFARKALSYLEAHYPERVTARTLAKEVGCSPRILHEKFRARYGVSPKSMLLSIRLHYATHLLTETDEKVDSIAHSVGFRSKVSFIRNFKHKFGEAPSAYRRCRQHSQRDR